MFHVKPDVNGATNQISKSQPGPRRTGPSPIQYVVVCRWETVWRVRSAVAHPVYPTLRWGVPHGCYKETRE